MLDPQSAKLSSFNNVQNGSFIHAVVSTAAVSFAVPVSQPADIESGTELLQTRVGVNPLGFDRLLAAGLSIDEVAALRTNFRGQIDDLATSVQQQTGEDNLLYRGRLEDLWISSQGPYSEFSLNLPAISSHLRQSDSEFGEPLLGTHRDFVWGFIMGFLLGFFMLFCVWERHVSHRQKMGILLGVMIKTFMDLKFNDQKNAIVSPIQSPAAIPT